MDKDYSAKELNELAGKGEPKCVCPRREYPFTTTFAPYKVHYRSFVPYHQDDCPMFEDNSHAESDTSSEPSHAEIY